MLDISTEAEVLSYILTSVDSRHDYDVEAGPRTVLN